MCICNKHGILGHVIEHCHVKVNIKYHKNEILVKLRAIIGNKPTFTES